MVLLSNTPPAPGCTVCETGADTVGLIAKRGLMRRVTLLAVLAAFVAVACNGEPETETFGSVPETDLVDAISDNVSDDPDRRFDNVTTDCLIQGIVDEFGEDGLADLADGFGGNESISGSAGVGFGPGGTSQSYHFAGLCGNWVTYTGS